MSSAYEDEQKTISSAAASIKSRPWLATLSEDFQRGVMIAQQTVVTPDLIVSEGTDFTAMAVASAMNHVFERMHPNVPKAFKELARKLAAEVPNKPEVKRNTDQVRAHRLARLENSPVTAPILLWVRQAGLVRAWASLEAFSCDVWVETLNQAGRALRRGAFESVAKSSTLNPSPSLSTKQIDIGVLAEHDFNLQDKVGTVLAGKCSFKTVAGITAAYKTAFGWSKGHPAPAFRNVATLRRIEWKRHVIVHRGGLMDREYARKAKVDLHLVGKPLELSPEAAVDDINEILMQGGVLVSNLALWLDAVDLAQ